MRTVLRGVIGVRAWGVRVSTGRRRHPVRRRRRRTCGAGGQRPVGRWSSRHIVSSRSADRSTVTVRGRSGIGGPFPGRPSMAPHATVL
eukprot:2506260-Prymnesium_polylepis.1